MFAWMAIAGVRQMCTLQHVTAVCFPVVQVILLGQQIDTAMTSKQEQLAAAISQLKDALHTEVERRLQASTSASILTLTCSMNALKEDLQGELVSLRSAVSELEGRAGPAEGSPVVNGKTKAWATDVDNLARHLSAPVLCYAYVLTCNSRTCLCELACLCSCLYAYCARHRGVCATGYHLNSSAGKLPVPAGAAIAPAATLLSHHRP